MNIRKVLGVDQSLNCTGVCLHTIKTTYGKNYNEEKHEYKYWMIPSKPTKKMLAFKHPCLIIEPYNRKTGTDYISKEIAKSFNIYDICDILSTIIVTEKPDALCIEGIAYGNTGSASLVDLAGLNYCIRMLSIRYGLELMIASPTSLKKMATGNGGATKDEMVWAWKKCDYNIKDINDIKVDDLADAFFLSKYDDTYNKILSESADKANKKN